MRVVLQNMVARTPHFMHHLGEKAKDSTASSAATDSQIMDMIGCIHLHLQS